MKRTGGTLLTTVAVVVAAVLGTVGSAAVTATGAAAAPARTRLAGDLPVLPAGAHTVGPTAPSSTVTAEVALAPRDPAALDAFVAAVSTPGSPRFRQYLSAGQFGAEFGATPQVIAATRSWLAGAGLTVGATDPDGLLVPVSGPVDRMERAFGVALEQTRLPTGRVARYNTAEPAVPTGLAGAVAGVLGLSTVDQPHAQLVRRGTTAGGAGSPSTTEEPSVTGPAPRAGGTCPTSTSGYSASQLAETYGFSQLYGDGKSGSGVTVGVYELEPYTPSDIATYAACLSLTTSPTDVAVDGGAVGQQQGEAALDIEDVMGLAPGAAIEVYSGPNANTGPIDVYAKMVDDDTAKVLTTSWGQCEAEMDPAEQAVESNLFAQAATQGQSMVAASGDSGSSDCYFPGLDNDTSLQVDDPSDQPYVTGVGGTSLESAGTTPLESVWNDGAVSGAGGGGVSSDFAQPAWQSGAGVDSVAAVQQCAAVGRSSCRESPDVAASADPAHGYDVYVTAPGAGCGGWCVFGGTSGASPLWAALLAVVEQGLASPLGFVNPTLYACGTPRSDFHDVTAGNNDLFTGGVHYPATSGYDLASGWGSPDGGTLAAALASPVSCPTVTRVNASYGLAAGGGLVTVTGTGFTPSSAVRFGSTPASPPVYQSATSLVVQVPPGPAGGGTVDVTVSNANGYGGTTPADRYTYLGPGYWLVGSDGGIFAFGDAGFYGSTGALALNRPVVGMAATPDTRGYWLVGSDGGIFAFGDAGFHGSTGALALNRPVVGMADTPDGGGYWLVASDGGIFAFGDAGFYGSTGGLPLNRPIVGMAPTPDGKGYWLVASDGGIFAFGDAGFHGSTGGQPLNRPVVGMATTPDGKGYWLVASDGGIFAFGDAAFYGSTGGLPLNRPIVGMRTTLDGKGYWLAGSDGGIFAFGDAAFYGSTGGLTLNRPIVGIGST